MPEMNETFTALLRVYAGIFTTTTYGQPTCAGLLRSIPTNVAGVYIINETGNNHRVLYICSAGKIHKGLKTSLSTIRRRMTGASTPYHFDRRANVFCYGPSTTGVPPAGYNQAVPVGQIEITCLAVKCPKAPTILEHLLIQGHINEFGALPDANQKI